MEGGIDVNGPLYSLCMTLGIDYNFVRELKITPRYIKAVVYSKNEEGKKFVGEDGFIALDTINFEVKS